MAKWVEEWIGVDLDSTLANSNSKGYEIGEPIEKMVQRIKQWRKEGKDVRIVTARVDGNTRAHTPEEAALIGDQWNPLIAITSIENWCQIHIGEILPVTDRKDCGMVNLYDDKAIRVNKDTGELCTGCRHHLMGVEQSGYKKQLGDYYEVEEIGGGVHSVVYKAIDHTGVVFALKGIREKYWDNRDVMDQFELECEASELLSLEFGFEDLEIIENQTYIKMNYYIGAINLEDEIKKGKIFSLKETIETLDSVAYSLDEIHSMGIYHCDIKPRNILFEFGKGIFPRLIDFGVVQFSDKEKYFGIDKIYGTVLGYIAPEIERGERATAKSDQYMLAVTAFEMLFGVRPGKGLTLMDKKSNEVFEKALNKNPSNRYNSCEEFIYALE
jgi:hypothetical protein